MENKKSDARIMKHNLLPSTITTKGDDVIMCHYLLLQQKVHQNWSISPNNFNKQFNSSIACK